MSLNVAVPAPPSVTLILILMISCPSRKLVMSPVLLPLLTVLAPLANTPLAELAYKRYTKSHDYWPKWWPLLCKSSVCSPDEKLQVNFILCFKNIFQLNSISLHPGVKLNTYTCGNIWSMQTLIMIVVICYFKGCEGLLDKHCSISDSLSNVTIFAC